MNGSSRRPIVAVFGSSTLGEPDPRYAEARALGAALARAGCAVMTGGYDGAMGAVSRGASEAGGHVIGVTVDLFEARGPVNRWVRERIHTTSLFARLEVLIERADAFVALSGSIGTLTEVFLAWTLLSTNGRRAAPIVLLGGHWAEWLAAHRSPSLVPERLFQFVETADTVEQLVESLARRGIGTPLAGGTAGERP